MGRTCGTRVHPYIPKGVILNTAHASVGQSPQAASLGQRWAFLLLAWLLALVSTLASLFFSEVMQMQPCVLCWYQRIAMFPLVIVLGIGVYLQDRGSILYALPLAAAGWLIAGYHVLLYNGWIPEGLQPCSKGVSCAKVDLQLAGFVTIPLLSLVAFTVVIALLVAARSQRRGG